MTGEDIILSAQKLTKKYPLKKPDGEKEGREFYALHNVSFTLRKGQALGIIGPNGSGKSTLLKILSDVLTPSSGQVEYNGTVLPILEIGTGFHPELSGYENIFFNAALLGMKKQEVRAVIHDIIAFSGIEEFIHEPVKNYSNGMYLRLALSVALFSPCTIMLFDEVIAVGDAEFRYKALNKVKELIAGGKACILVSHDLNTVSSLCDSCLVMEQGSVIFSGPARKAIETYLDQVNQKIKKSKESDYDHPRCRFIKAWTEKETWRMDEDIKINLRYEKKTEAFMDVMLVLRHFDRGVMHDSAVFREDHVNQPAPPGIYESQCLIPANIFSAGKYSLDFKFGDEVDSILTVTNVADIVVQLPEWEADKRWNKGAEFIPIRLRCQWETKRL